MAALTETDVHGDVDYDIETFKVGPYQFDVTTIAYMPIEVLMSMGERKVEISGQRLWCGSLAVVEFLLAHPKYVENNCILELGAGTGVLGMLCSRLGATKVLLTDNDTRSLNHMTADCDRNKVAAQVMELDWFKPPTDGELDTLKSPGNEPFKVVAGDVLYKRALLEPFMNITKKLLEYFNAEMLLCHVPRAGIDQEDILQLSKDKGISVTVVDRSLWCKDSVLEYCPEDDYSRACLYRLCVPSVSQDN